MVNPKELRIGNYIYFNPHGKRHLKIIKELRERDLVCYDNAQPNQRLALWYDGGDVETIPLTPEWLQQCGLRDVAGNGMGYRMNINSSDELCWYMQENSLSYQTQGSGFTRSMEHVQYVHQLQNWFYSFTGAELPINLHHSTSASGTQ